MDERKTEFPCVTDLRSGRYPLWLGVTSRKARSNLFIFFAKKKERTVGKTKTNNKQSIGFYCS